MRPPLWHLLNYKIMLQLPTTQHHPLNIWLPLYPHCTKKLLQLLLLQATWEVKTQEEFAYKAINIMSFIGIFSSSLLLFIEPPSSIHHRHESCCYSHSRARVLLSTKSTNNAFCHQIQYNPPTTSHPLVNWRFPLKIATLNLPPSSKE